MKKTINNIFIALVITSLVFLRVGLVLAEGEPTPPPAPTAPTAPQAPTVPTAPPAPTAPTPAPTAPSAPTPPPSSTPAPSSTPQPAAPAQQSTPSPAPTSPATVSSSQSSPTITSSDPGGQVSDGGVGSTNITTGDATNTANLSALGDNNLSGSSTLDSSASISATNSGNGDNSTNNSSASVVNSDNTNQTNSAVISNGLSQQSITGQNTASRNTGGDSTITTGDANITGTVITAVNTNVDGVAVAEFNIADNHTGDLILDFGSNCISGCSGSTQATNLNNGTDSNNNLGLVNINNDNNFQSNDATVGSTLTLTADSGSNTASRNTNGDSTITTGDANVAANALTFANNNIIGGVIYGVVNIFGNLIGDIILPESTLAGISTNSCSSCLGDVSASDFSNGDDSTNNIALNQSLNDTSSQTNLANIDNNLLVNANSGENLTSRNTGGNNSITTGSSSVDANVLNVANTNVEDGNIWLVIVNQAGQWVGKILGGDGSNYAGSDGMEFTVDQNGEITASNSGNGAGSTNNINVNSQNNTNNTQSNTANIANQLNLSANTGNNRESSNTGGDSSIYTGDAKVVANLVNFVNNNIKGKGKLVVTVVNVFGSWFGDFVTPGNKKEEKLASNQSNSNPPSGGTGGSSNPGDQNGSNNNNSNNVSGNAANNSSAPTGSTQLSTTITKVSVSGSGQFVAALAGFTQSAQPKLNLAANNILGQKTDSQAVNINLAWVAIVLVPLLFLITLFKLRNMVFKIKSLKIK